MSTETRNQSANLSTAFAVAGYAMSQLSPLTCDDLTDQLGTDDVSGHLGAAGLCWSCWVDTAEGCPFGCGGERCRIGRPEDGPNGVGVPLVCECVLVGLEFLDDLPAIARTMRTIRQGGPAATWHSDTSPCPWRCDGDAGLERDGLACQCVRRRVAAGWGDPVRYLAALRGDSAAGELWASADPRDGTASLDGAARLILCRRCWNLARPGSVHCGHESCARAARRETTTRTDSKVAGSVA